MEAQAALGNFILYVVCGLAVVYLAGALFNWLSKKRGI